MDSDLIRAEIETTAARIGEELQILEARALRVARTAVAGTLVVATGLAVVTVVLVVSRYRRTRSHTLQESPPARLQVPDARVAPRAANSRER